MKNTILNLMLIIVLALVLGILTGCVQNEEIISNESAIIENVVEEEKDVLLTEFDAKSVLKEKYELAEKIYSLSMFDYDSSAGVALENTITGSYFLINNFDEVTSNMTENAKNNLIKNHSLLIEENGNYYVMLGGAAEGVDSAVLQTVESNTNEIVATYKLDVFEGEFGNEIKTYETEFILKYEEGRWLIDKFEGIYEILARNNNVEE